MTIPRSVETRLRKVIQQVHERKLAESLKPVEEAIARWHAGEGSVFDIDEAMDQHRMRSRRFWHLYANTAVTSPEVGFILDEALKLGLLGADQHKELVGLWNRPRAKSEPPRPRP